MENKSDIYYNEFFEGVPKLSGEDLKTWMEENRRRKKTFAEHPTVNNLTRRDVWNNRAKFYFLPFLFNCYKFTRQNELPHFAIPVSPTCMFHRDRLHLRNYMDTIHQTFFSAMDMCIPRGEKIMLLVEKRFHIEDPVDGGTQQLYNMLWDYDLSALVKGERIFDPSKVILPPVGAQEKVSPRMGLVQDENLTRWDENDLNPAFDREHGIDLCRRTCWLADDLLFLGKKYYLIGQEDYPEILDLSKYPEDKQPIYARTARTFFFKVFEPKEGAGDDMDSSDTVFSDLEDDDDFDFDSTLLGELDSTLDFVEDDEEMNKIIAFFAKMPKVTGLVQGMIDMVTALTRILPLVIVKIDDDKLKDSLNKTINILNLGLNKVLKICAYLGIKVERKQSAAIGEIVKNRFKKDKKDFMEYEIDELNKSLDELEDVDDEKPPKPPKGQIPLDVKPNHLYPQKMPLRPPVPPKPPIVVPPEPPPVPVKPPPPPPKPEVDSSGPEIKPEPLIPSVMPEPPNHPPKGENGIQ